MKKKRNRCLGKISGLGSKLVKAGMLCAMGMLITGNGLSAQAATARQVEALNRGLVGVKTADGVYLSWRLLGTEAYDTAFNLYRNGEKIAGPIENSTNYLDAGGSANDTYFVRKVVNGVEKTESESVSVWSSNYLDVPIDKPADTTVNDEAVTYSANDATVADVDGDGAYEIILKWDPSNAKDNSQSGYTGNVYLDCYELTGQRKWRIDLGKNIRAGAHYTQFMAYDLDGDGKAEVAMKTADGTVAGDGTVIGDSSKDYRNSGGYILDGPEYLTLFEGETGKIIDTIDYEPARGDVSSWGDSWGNRVDRFLATIAYLDGKTPSLVMCRGYYTRAVLVAYQYKDGKLQKQWTFDSNSNSAYVGQGNHNLTSADVDDDGCDEIVYGSCVIDHNGQGLYSTGQGHGDAMHVGDFDPDHEGLEVFQVHEEKTEGIESVQMRDAKTGQTLWCAKTGTDVGRGIIANIDPDYYPYVAVASTGKYDRNGNTVDIDMGKFGVNFLIWWDGDLYREGLDQTYINKWNYNTKGIDRLLTGSDVHSNNSTKANPSLSGDILGDWREEVIWPKSDNTALRIYTTTTVTEKKLYTLVHDIQYRESIAWQNVAYNQPPHTSYYMGEDMPTPTQPDVYAVGDYTETEVDAVKEGAVIEEGLYTIKNVGSGLCLDVTGGEAANGTNVQQWGAAETPASYNTWKVESVGDGYYKIYSLVGDGSYLMDVESGKVENGTNIQIYQDTNSDAQLFKFVKNMDGTYGIFSKVTEDRSGLMVADDSTSSGGNICQWTYSGKDSQKWILRKVPTDEEKNPIVKYEFEQAENNTVEDKSGNNHSATLYGNATCVEDIEKGNVLYLDGNDGTYVQLPDGIFDGKSDLTISLNAKSETDAATNFFTFTIGQDNVKYYFNKVSTTGMRTAISSNGWQTESQVSGESAGDAWHNYIVVLSENAMKIYVDGTKVAENTNVSQDISDWGTGLKSYLGKSFFSADKYYKGYLDNVAVYGYGMNDTEAATLAQESLAAPHTHSYTKSYSYDENGHYHECIECHAHIDETPHNLQWIVDKEPTETEDGSRHEKCFDCGYEGKTEVIPATGQTATTEMGEATTEEITELTSEEERTTEQTTELTTEDKVTTEQTTELTTEDKVTTEQTTELTTEDEVSTEQTTELTTEDKVTTEQTTELMTEDKMTTEQTTELTSEEERTTEQTTELTSEDKVSTERTTELASEDKTTERTTELTTEEEGTTEKVTELTSEDKTTTEKPTELTSEDKTTTEKPTELTSEDKTTTEKPTELTSEDKTTTEKPTELTSEDKTTTEKPTELTSEDKTTTEKPTELTSEDKTTTEKPTELTTADRVTTEEKTTELTTESRITTENETTKLTTEGKVTTEQRTELTTENRTTTATRTELTTQATTELTTEAINVVTKVTVTPDVAKVTVGDTVGLVARVEPGTANQTVVWTSSDKVVATVDVDGKVTAKKAGTVVIKATSADGKQYGECLLTVQPVVEESVAVESIELNVGDLSLAVGAKAVLEATISPANAGNQEIVWQTSNAAVATVDSGTGEVTAVSSGKAIITAITADGNKTAKCVVIVKEEEPSDIAVSAIFVTEKNMTIKPGETKQLSVIVEPENATNKEVSYKSSDTGIVVVNADGKLIGMKEGTAVITITSKDGGKMTYCLVNVSSEKEQTIAVEQVSLPKDTLALTVGESQMLTAEISPADATNQNLIWSSTDETVLSVDNTGKVTALKEGGATVIVRTQDGGKEAYCTVTVKAKEVPSTEGSSTEVEVTGIVVNPTTVTLDLKKTKTLKVTVKPANATNQTVDYTSSNTAVATVSQSGTVKAVAPGVATIKVKAGTKEKKVTVKVKPAKVTALKKKILSKTKIRLSWKKQSKVTGYKVYRYNTATKKYKLYKITKKNYVSVANLKKNTTHKFKVKAYKRSGSVVVNGDTSAVYTVKIK